jgi:hypothetical protein
MADIRFTLADAERANEEWGANCGPCALAAVLGLTLDQVRPLVRGFEDRGYVNPMMMTDALARSGARWKAASLQRSSDESLRFPDHGLARIQWEGPWTAPDVNNKRWAYRYTHWVGAARRKSAISIFDVNALGLCSGWMPLETWSRDVVPMLLASIPRASGTWHITHAIEVQEPSALDLRMAG